MSMTFAGCDNRLVDRNIKGEQGVISKRRPLALQGPEGVL